MVTFDKVSCIGRCTGLTCLPCVWIVLKTARDLHAPSTSNVHGGFKLRGAFRAVNRLMSPTITLSVKSLDRLQLHGCARHRVRRPTALSQRAAAPELGATTLSRLSPCLTQGTTNRTIHIAVGTTSA